MLNRSLEIEPTECDDCCAMFEGELNLLAEGVFKRPTHCPFCGSSLS